MSPRKILIQHRETKQFFKNRRSWTNDPSNARSFSTALSAFRFALDSQLQDVEIVWVSVGEAAVQKIITERGLNSPTMVSRMPRNEEITLRTDLVSARLSSCPSSFQLSER